MRCDTASPPAFDRRQQIRIMSLEMRAAKESSPGCPRHMYLAGNNPASFASEQFVGGTWGHAEDAARGILSPGSVPSISPMAWLYLCSGEVVLPASRESVLQCGQR